MTSNCRPATYLFYGCHVLCAGCWSKRRSIKTAFHDADTDTDWDIFARILADTSDMHARFPEVIPDEKLTTRQHSCDDPREEIERKDV